MIKKNHFFTFDGKSSRDFGVYLVGNAVYNAPEREYNKVSVPGRNGDLLIDLGRYANLELPYTVIVYEDFDQNITGLRNWILSRPGYRRLEDTYFPEEFRIARFSNLFEMEEVKHSDIGYAEITFDCKPQRFLKSGEIKKVFSANGRIYNPTQMEAKPLIRVYGVGQVGIGNQTITITQADEYTDIDCDLQDAFKGTTNCNGNIVLNSGGFFSIPSGNVGVSLGSGITKVEITPRWWRL